PPPKSRGILVLPVFFLAGKSDSLSYQCTGCVVFISPSSYCEMGTCSGFVRDAKVPGCGTVSFMRTPSMLTLTPASDTSSHFHLEYNPYQEPDDEGYPGNTK